MVGYVLDAARALGPERIVVVVGYQADKVRACVAEQFALAGVGSQPGGPQDYVVDFALQEPQLGTGHAFLAAREAIGDGEADLLLLYGDIPLLRAATLRQLLTRHRDEQATATVLTAVMDDPAGYGRILRDPATGGITRIVEETDATPEQRAVREVNSGVYCFKLPDVLGFLDEITSHNQQNEFYLVDLIAILLVRGHKVATLRAADPEEVAGVNTRSQLARAEARKRAEILEALMLSGVSVVDPASTYVDWGVEVGADTVLEPGTVLRGRTRVGTGSTIGPWTQLLDATVGDRCRVWSSVVEGSEIADGASVGPFSRIRPGTRVGPEARIGNFAEVKNSVIGEGAKIQHHSYVGDADVGARVNVGAGTVVVNYDGVRKHRTVIGAGAFIGCNTNLVAPVKVGDGAYTAAGSTVTLDVPPGSLAVARPRQSNLPGWVERRRAGTFSAEVARSAGAGSDKRTGNEATAEGGKVSHAKPGPGTKPDPGAAPGAVDGREGESGGKG